MIKIQQIFQNEEIRLPSSAHNLRPDCSAIHSAEKSDDPEAWLLHPTGITFKFDAKLKTVQKKFIGRLTKINNYKTDDVTLENNSEIKKYSYLEQRRLKEFIN